LDWTLIGNPGNAANPRHSSQLCGPIINQPCGAVSYYYNIGTYEVTNAQHVEFLNATAASDPLELYNPNMADPSATGSYLSGYGGITRTGNAGSYTYSAIAGRENMPVNYVTFYDALRFANWMNNGQGNASTETGAYTLLGGTPTPSNGTTALRNVEAAIVLPNENEWYKAAYYDVSSTQYHLYSTGSNTHPECVAPTATLNSANCNNQVGDLTSVGSYTHSPSRYGTFDQTGNVSEWSEAKSDSLRGFRGGSFSSFEDFSAEQNSFADPTANFNKAGFRLVMIPEPGTGLLVIAGLLGFAGWRRARA
jgi:formylglycine-generating enzyme required for sulfatase activity